jgi:hypothetical protein
MIASLFLYSDLKQIFDLRKPEKELKSKAMAHGKTIMKVAWHPTVPNVLASGSRDHLVKVWNTQDWHHPSKVITNVESVDRLKWIPSDSHRPSILLGIGSILGDTSLSIWDIQSPFIPRHTFKTDSKNKISDFVFTSTMAVYSTKSISVVAESFLNAPSLVDERRGHPLCCDILENYCFAYDSETSESESTKTMDILAPRDKHNRQIHFFNAHSINSCYEQDCQFASQEEELLFFVEKYKVVSGHPLQSLLVNADLCKQVEKSEIASIWLSLHELLLDDNLEDQTSSPRQYPADLKSGGSAPQEKVDTMATIMAFYREHPEKFLTDIHNQRLMVVEKEAGREPEFMILENYEKMLLEEVRTFQPHELDDELTSIQKSKAVLSVVNELIDNGEFIHGYQMYVCLSPLIVELDPKQVRLWTGTYIDLITTMGFYNKANYLVKHSTLEIFEGLQKKLQPMHAKCCFCKVDIEPMQKGVCSKCTSARKCGICQKSVNGLTLWCQICGHGGHFPEMKRWFERPTASCPTGCGHVCFKFY